MKQSFFVIAILTAAFSLRAQTVLENNPPGLKWRQIMAPHFRVLYPEGFETPAQRVARSLEQLRDEGAESLGRAPRPITFILQNQSAVSNGFVSILPRRSEFFTMPTQDYNFIGTNDWLDLLTVHEYRHVVQYQHATRGFNKAIYYLFGSISLAGMAQAAAPPWFWEGDAVAVETALTPSGRGKIPNFSLLMKTNLLEGRRFNYHKQSLGSYKHRIPDSYVLGYHMVNYLRRKTDDPNIWGKITARSWNVPFIPFAFSNAIRKETGLYVTDLYDEMARQLAEDWQRELAAVELTPYVRVGHTRRTGYTDYLYPQPLPDGSVLALKKGIGHIETFVRLSNKEETVFVPGMMNDTGMLSAEGSKVVWNEFGFDPRWRVRNYSQIKVYDLATGQRRRIGPKTSRYAGAALSPSGDLIVTVETSVDYQTRLVVLNTQGEEVAAYPNPENHFYAMPRWSDDGRTLAVLKTTGEGKTITLVDFASGEMRDVLPVTHENVGYPVLHGRYLLFNSPVTGIDNIFAVDLEQGKRYQVTSSRLGAYNPAVSEDGQMLYYNEQTRDGMDIVRIDFDSSAWKPFEGGRQMRLFFRHLVEQEGNPDVLRDLPDTQYPDKPYRKIRGMINPYHWGVNVDGDLTEASIGIASRDILSTTAINLGYYYDIQERTSSLIGQVSYQGWYPIIDVSASYANRSVNEGQETFYDTLVNPVRTERRDIIFRWKEKNVEAGLRLPLLTTTSKYHGNVSIANHVGLTQVFDFENNIDGGGRFIPRGDDLAYFYRDYIDNGTLAYNRFSLSAFRMLKRSHRDINSKWGQQAEITSFETPFGGDFSGRLFAAFGAVYLPGLARHHSIWGYGAFQYTQIQQVEDNYFFRNQVPTPRGLRVSRFENFYSASANYTLPLWYPDIAIGPLINIQRLRGNVFFDYAFGESPRFQTSRTYASLGVEARIDINIMRFLPQLDVGLRLTQGLQPSVREIELLIGTFRF